jgi:hypothetical protein
MRTLTIFLSLTLGVFAAEQRFGRAEDALLKKLLGDAKATSITVSKSQRLPDKRDLTICVYAPRQSRLRADFGEWLAEWNKADGEKHGRVEVTEDASRADVILARLVVIGRSEVSDPTYTSGVVGTDPVTRRPVTQAEMPVESYSEAKVYTYVIARGPSALTILWRGTDTARTNRGIVGPFPRNAETTAQQRAAREIDVKGSKDSKRAGDRLRDEFFKMMRERAKG